jgi:hypothetical protein
MIINLKKTVVGKRNSLLISFLYISVICMAQAPPVNEPDYSRPALFNNLPDTVAVDEADILSLFNRSLGEQVQLKMTNTFFYQGSIKSIVIYENPRRISLVIKSSNKLGSALYISKITEINGQVLLRGRIISNTHIDAYDLAYSKVTGYRLQKINYYKLVSE